jgi:hypothetical protein
LKSSEFLLHKRDFSDDLLINNHSTTVSLTRGVKAKFPCPVCLVPKDELSNLSKLHQLRHQQEMQEIVTNAMTPGVLVGECERQLKAFGLRPIYVSTVI